MIKKERHLAASKCKGHSGFLEKRGKRRRKREENNTAKYDEGVRRGKVAQAPLISESTSNG